MGPVALASGVAALAAWAYNRRPGPLVTWRARSAPGVHNGNLNEI